MVSRVLYIIALLNYSNLCNVVTVTLIIDDSGKLAHIIKVNSAKNSNVSIHRKY